MTDRLPKPFRSKSSRTGAHVGSWKARVDGKIVNLRTTDAVEARRRLKLAIAGKWPASADDAADAIVDAFDSTAPEPSTAPETAANPIGSQPSPGQPAAGPAPPAVSAAPQDGQGAADPGPSGTPVHPDSVIPPPGEAWNDAAASSEDGDPSAMGDEGSAPQPPGALDSLLAVLQALGVKIDDKPIDRPMIYGLAGAAVVVGPRRLAAAWTKTEPVETPYDALLMGIGGPAAIAVAEKYLPTIETVSPEWLLAGVVGASLVTQIMFGRKKEPAPRDPANVDASSDRPVADPPPSSGPMATSLAVVP